MKTRIVASLEQGDREELERQWASSRRLRERMVELLKGDVDAIHASMRDEESLSNPAWAYAQATKIGETKALLKIISLLS